jgi:hypothetical protein
MTAAVAMTMGFELQRMSRLALLGGRFSYSFGFGLGVRIALRDVASWEKKRDPESAPFAAYGPVGDNVYKRALELAGAGREDLAAVRELRAMASTSGQALDQAERLARLGGDHLESVVGDRCYRLVVAALGDHAIEKPKQRDIERFDAIAGFKALSAGTHWRRLTELEPRLLSLEQEMCDGVFVRPEHQENAAQPRAEQRQRNAERARRWYAFQERVGALLGPTAGQADPFLSSRDARDRAVHHLMQLVISN